jgi:hypothetical protein
MVWKKPLLQGHSPGNVHAEVTGSSVGTVHHEAHTNPRHMVTQATKFCTVASGIFSIIIELKEKQFQVSAKHNNIRGVSGKFPNVSHKNFPVLP